jgi:hypothetical protein
VKNPVTPPIAEQRRSTASVDPQLVQMLAGLDADANLEVVQRTRRAVMVAANERHAARARSQRQLGMILLALGILVMMMTPAIWVVAQDLLEGEMLQDGQTLVMSLVVTVFSAVFAALILTWRNRESRSREGL